MPASLLAALRRMELRELPAPEPGPGEVLIELTAVGICGSDLHYWRHGRIGDQVVRFPYALGHEPAGVVAGLGRGVRKVAAGQHVAVEPGIPCGACRECRMGRSNLCPHIRFLGSPPVGGAFQRYLVMPEECVEPLPAGVDDALGAACEPLGVALQALDLARLRAAERVAIIGGGPVGLCCAALARRLGGEVVALSEPRVQRQRVARALGVPRVTSAQGEEFLAAVAAGTEKIGADVVLECSGAPEGLALAIAAAARGGRAVLVGIPEVDEISVDPHLWRRKELELFNVRRSNAPLTRCLRLLAESDLGLRAAGFFTGTIGLAGVQEALVDLDDDASAKVKVMVDPRRGD